MSTFLGIDPGKTGDLAIVTEEASFAIPMPIIGKGRNGQVDAKGVLDFFASLDVTFACIEKVGAMPGQGSVSMFSFGQAFGTVVGIVEGAGVPYALVPPQTWQEVDARRDDRRGEREVRHGGFQTLPRSEPRS